MVRKNSKTIFLAVEGIGDRAIEYGSGTTVADIARAMSSGQANPASGHANAALGQANFASGQANAGSGQANVVQTIQVARTASVLPPALLIEAANLRFGDSIRIITLNPDIEVDESLVASCSARIEVLSGPVAGTSYELQPGISKLGRVSVNDVTIVDPSISREHATITVTTASILIEDNGSTNGVTVGGELITQPTLIRSGERIKLGQSEALVTHTIVPARVPDDSYLDIPSPGVARYQGRDVSLPSPPLMADGGARRSSRLSLGRNPQKQEVELFHMMLATLTSQLEQEQQIEQAVRLVESPSFSEVVQAVAGRTSLWAKRAADPSGIEARVGIGNAPSRNRFESVAGGPQELRAKLAGTVERFSSVPAAPVTVDFRQLGTVGIQGPIDQARGLAYSLVGQLSATFGPDQLGIAFRPGDLSDAWDWLKWLPHVDFVGSATGVTGDHFVGWVSALFDEANQGPSTMTARPAAILIVLDDDRPLPLAILSRLILEGPALGIHALLISSESRGFDAELGASIRVLDGIASLHRPNAEPIPGIALETCDRSQVEGLARMMAPIGYRSERSETGGPDQGSAGHDGSQTDQNTIAVRSFELGGEHPGILATMQRRSITPPGQPGVPGAGGVPIGTETSQLPAAGQVDLSQTPLVGGPPAAPLAERPREQVPALQPLPEELAASVNAISLDQASVEANGSVTGPEGDGAAMPPPPGPEDAVPPSAEPSMEVPAEEYQADTRTGSPAEFPDEVSAEPAADGPAIAEAVDPAPAPPSPPALPDSEPIDAPPEAAEQATPAEDVDGHHQPPADSPTVESSEAESSAVENPADDAPVEQPTVNGPVDGAEDGAEDGSEGIAENGAEDGAGQGPGESPAAQTPAPPSPPTATEPEPEEPPLSLSSLPHPKDDSRLVLGTVHVEGGKGPAVFALNLPRDRSLGLAGGPGTGKTTALRSVAAAAGMLQVPPAHIPMVYYLDVHGDLDSIGSMPHVSGAAKNDIVGFRSVISTLEELVDTRLREFEAADADSLADYRVNRPDESIGRVIVLADDVIAVAELLDSLHPGRWWELAGKIIEHGGRIGVHLVFSVNKRNELDAELIPQVGRWLRLGTAAADGSPGYPGQAVVGKGRVRFATTDGPAAGADLSVRKAG